MPTTMTPYRLQYRATHPEKVTQWQKTASKNRKAKSELNWENWLDDRLKALRGSRRGRPLPVSPEITLPWLLELLRSQGYFCAGTALHMEHTRGPFACSIDRIDNAVAYMPGNIQLTTCFYQFGKNRYTDKQARAFISALRANDYDS